MPKRALTLIAALVGVAALTGSGCAKATCVIDPIDRGPACVVPPITQEAP